MLTAETGLAGRPDRHHSPLPPRDRPSRAGRRTPGNPAETPPRLDGFDDLRVSCVSLAQLELGLRAAKDLATYRLRRARLDQITEQFGPGEPFDPACVQAFGRLLDHMAAAGGDLKANREDRMIAATALALDCAIVTRNPSDFRILEPLITVEVR